MNNFLEAIIARSLWCVEVKYVSRYMKREEKVNSSLFHCGFCLVGFVSNLAHIFIMQVNKDLVKGTGKPFIDILGPARITVRTQVSVWSCQSLSIPWLLYPLCRWEGSLDCLPEPLLFLWYGYWWDSISLLSWCLWCGHLQIVTVNCKTDHQEGTFSLILQFSSLYIPVSVCKNCLSASVCP